MPRSRESTSKVRTGCSTCKARRVKCDEAKPACRRCTVGGRHCNYKAAPSPTSWRNAITIYLPPVQNQPVFCSKDRSLYFFDKYLATALDEHFEARFWNCLVLQLAHSEPTIQLAIAAASVVYEDVESSLRNPAGNVSVYPRGQKEWATAARSLSAHIDRHPESTLVPLVCCLLFTCIEWLRCNPDTSWLHVRNGVQILTGLRRASKQPSRMQSPSFRSELAVVEQHVVPIFSRLNVLYSLTNGPTAPLYSLIENDGEPHRDLPDSRRRLYNICTTVVHFIQETIVKAELFQISMEDLVEQARLKAQLHDWRTELEKLIERRKTGGRPVNGTACHLLLVQYGLMRIWLSVCVSAGGELTTTDDNELAAFEAILQSAEQIMNHAGSGNRSGAAPPGEDSLSFDVHRLGTLWYTVKRCRHPVMRRHTMELLRLTPRRAHVWNAHYADEMAKQVIEVEG